MKKILCAGMSMLFFFFFAMAQHEHHMKQDTAATQEEKHQHDESPMHDDHDMMDMPSHAFSRNLPMSRNGSGTSWLPDASPMYMFMKTRGQTSWMVHGNIFFRYTNTDVFNNGTRGSNKVDAPNWVMVMMNHKAGKKGLLNAELMVSLDRLTEGGNGYPLLFQSGETYKGHPLVDRQHPHDLFSGLTVGYTHMINKNIDIYANLGYPGEPALGPPAFMHRISSIYNADAPLGHHWQDATHIVFGVATIGVRYKNFKVEGSSFTGREPDEDRYNFDRASFNSYSYRVSYNPSKNWAVQVSQGFIKSPEWHEPGEDVTRTTASVLYSSASGTGLLYNAALVWGYNDKTNGDHEHSVLLEDNFQFGKNAIFSRYEFVQKSSHELDLHNLFPESRFNIHVVSAGYNRLLVPGKIIDMLAGVQATLNLPDKKLKNIYGHAPMGMQAYLQFRPSLHRH